MEKNKEEMKTVKKEYIETLKEMDRFHNDPIFATVVVDLEEAYNDINQHTKSHLEEIRATVKNMETLDAIKEEFIYEKIIQLINFQIEKLK